MHGPTGQDAPKRSWLEHPVVRWVVVSVVAAVTTLALFIFMMRLVDGSVIWDRILRLFPLEFASVEVDPCEGWESRQLLVTIEGSVGFYAPEGFVPLADAAIVGEHAPEDGVAVEVAPDGVFRFVTGFAIERPAACSELDEPGTKKKRLIIQAPGCVSRDVPVGRSWIPHRVLLECDSRV